MVADASASGGGHGGAHHPQTPSSEEDGASCADRPEDDRIPLPAEPPASARAKRWIPARQAAFLRALEETLSVGKAAKSVGMSRQSAYKLRRRMAGQPFAEGWEMAVADLRLDEALEPAGSQRCPVCGAAPARPPAPRPGRDLW